jgi:pyruvate/2-oxoglutarate dehydrogenase complex dihydrolipoamide dehydrogenase (E3) component
MGEFSVETAIIGGGQAGVPLARALAGAGRIVALFERAHLGGSCVNFGCTPSKALIASARIAADARHASEWGIRIPTIDVDFAAVMARVRGLVADAKGSLDSSFAGHDNPRVIAAYARLDGRQGDRFRLRAGSDLVLAERVVLDTGTRSAMPPVEGLDRVPFLDAENWLQLDELPRRMMVLGGSYIALEMAQAFRRLGGEVIVLQQGKQLMEREDADVAEAIQQALERDGVEVQLGANVRSVEARKGALALRLADGEAQGTHLFVATGRKPNTDDLGLDTVGLEPGRNGIIDVDGRLATAVAGIWAVGDIRGGPAFTHTAYADFRVLESLFLGDGSVERPKIIPYAMFTEPELGRVGLSETQARVAGRAVKVARRDMAESGKARDLGRTAGFIKVVLDAHTDQILGATVLSTEGAEVVQLFVELMNAGSTAQTMLEAVHIHPTLAEAAKNVLVDALG